MEVEYGVSPGKLVTVTTWAVILLFAGCLLGIPYMIYVQKGPVPVLYFTVALMLALYIPILLIAWAYTPRKYVVSEKGILIDRPLGSILIPMEKITGIEEKDLRPLRTIRKFGNGGLFGITGRFWNREEGDMYIYARNSNYVMIHADRKYILSPDERFQFVNHVRKLIEGRR